VTNKVINLCGIKSNGGLKIAEEILKQQNYKDTFVIYDNKKLEKNLINFKNQYLNLPRFLHPFLINFVNRDTARIINNSNSVIHVGGIAFKSKSQTITFIQNILPLVKPLSSTRNLLLNILYKRSFKISKEILVQQKHVSNLINIKNKVRIIGNFELKEPNNNTGKGFIAILENVKNKNPKFLIELVNILTNENRFNFTLVLSGKIPQKLVRKLKQNSNLKIVKNDLENEFINELINHKVYIHVSKFETVGLPIYEAMLSGLNVVIPKEDYFNFENENSFLYELNNINDALEKSINAISVENNSKIKVPVYFENWS
jgi:hypothetical protein